MRRSAGFVVLILAAVLGLAPAAAQEAGDGVSVVDSVRWGRAFIATFDYQLQSEDTESGPVSSWRLDVNYSGAARISNAWMLGYGGRIEKGYSDDNDVYQISNTNSPYKNRHWVMDRHCGLQ
jgi:hypothetical protein